MLRNNIEEKRSVYLESIWDLLRTENVLHLEQEEQDIYVCPMELELQLEKQSFCGLLYLLEQEKQIWEYSEIHSFESKQTISDVIQCIIDLMNENKCNPYGIYAIYTLENAVLVNEVIRNGRTRMNLTQNNISEGIVEPENFSRFENGKLNIRWNKVSKMLIKLKMESEKETLILDTMDCEVLENCLRSGKMNHQSQTRFSRELVKELEHKLDTTSDVNKQYIGIHNLIHQKETFQITNMQTIKEKAKILLQQSVPDYPNIDYSVRRWTRNEILILNLYANVLNEEKRHDEAIALHSQVMQSFMQDTIRKTWCTCLQALVMENLSCYLGG